MIGQVVSDTQFRAINAYGAAVSAIVGACYCPDHPATGKPPVP